MCLSGAADQAPDPFPRSEVRDQFFSGGLGVSKVEIR
jgi:hypothetical protein